MRAWLTTLVMGLLACDGTSNPVTAVSVESTLFDHPQALAFIGDRLVVANTGFDPDDWRPGELLLVQVDTLEVERIAPTAMLNPQRLVVDEDRLVVVETGILDLSDFDNPRATTPGAIEVFPLTEAGLDNNSTVYALDSAPIDLALRGQRAVVSSALQPIVWSLDLSTNEDEVAAPSPLMPSAELGLGAVKPWRDGFVLVDFNSDYLHVLDDAGLPTGCNLDLGESDAIEGAQSPWVEGDLLYVVLALSGVIRRVDLGRLSGACEAPVETVVSNIGQIPNDLHVRGDDVYVVHSADNNVVVYGLDDGIERRRYILPRGSNPWHAAFSPDGRTLAVTEWRGQGVSFFDVETGVRRRVGATNAP